GKGRVWGLYCRFCTGRGKTPAAADANKGDRNGAAAPRRQPGVLASAGRKGQHMKIRKRRWWLAAAAPAIAAAAVLGTVAASGAGAVSGKPGGVGPISGLLPRDHLTTESAIQVNLSKETVRLPLYPGGVHAGTPHAEKVWYVLLDASDPGLAHDLGVNYAPKLANIAIGDPAAVQTVTLTNPSPAQN